MGQNEEEQSPTVCVVKLDYRTHRSSRPAMRALAVSGGVPAGPEGGPDPVSVLMEVERALRELASDLQLRREPRREVTRRDAERIREAHDKAMTVLGEEGSWLSSVKQLQELLWPGPDLSVADYQATLLARVSDSLRRVLAASRRAALACEGLPYDDRFCVGTTSAIAPAVRELAERVESLTGRKCGFGIRASGSGRGYDLPSLLNDASNCVHVLAEWIAGSGLPTQVRRVGRRCHAMKDADRRLVELCAKWDERASERGDFYLDEDARALTALVGREEATFRVGSSPRHATRVTRDGVFLYYDRDPPVVNVVKYLMESAGYACTVPADGVLECEPPRRGYLEEEGVVERLADVISWVTSADSRLNRGFEEHCEEECMEEDIDEPYVFEMCVTECINRIKHDERMAYNYSATRPGAHFEPHPVAARDLEEFGIGWHRHQQQQQQ